MNNQDYLTNCKITENNPAVLFNWHFDVLKQFVDGANQNIVPIPQAFFITTTPGNMSIPSLLNDLMILLSRVSGGRNGNSLLAPNTLSQYGNIRSLLRDIETNTWVQHLFDQFIPMDSFLATVSHIIDPRRCNIAHATPSGLVPAHGFRQVFQ